MAKTPRLHQLRRCQVGVEGSRALHYAARYGHADLLRCLIEAARIPFGLLSVVNHCDCEELIET